MSSQFLSMPTMMRGMFRMAENERSPRLYKQAMPSATAGLREELLASGRQPDAVLRLLAEMDRKMDALLALLQRESLSGGFPNEAHIVELSGSGLTMECSAPLEPGNHLELLLLLDEYPMRVLSVLARVDEQKAVRPLTGPPARVYALTFVQVDEEDREAVIRFVFSEERKRIRQQKGDA